MQETQTPEQLQRRVTILTRLAEISAVLNSTFKLKPLLSTIMDAAAEITESDAASVLLLDAKTGELRFAATTTGDTGQHLLGKSVPIEGSIAGTALRDNRVVASDDVSNDPRHYRKIDDQNDYNTRNILAVPMRSKNRVIGVLEAINKRQIPWTQDDTNYLLILAAQAAVAIEVAQLISQLQRANDELNQLDKMKSDFIAIASHELRTPLGVILGYASFLQETTDDEVRGHADKVVKSALQLKRIIEDMTNLRYLEQNEGELHRETLTLTAMLNEVLEDEDLRPLLTAKRHQMQVMPIPEVSIAVDRIRMCMALMNIVMNAVRFTPDGGKIRVSAQIHGREIWIHIADNGVGISKDDLERIFERFVQVEDHMTRTNGGLGIGLSIARALVEAHGGRVWAESAGMGHGSVFTLTLPVLGQIPLGNETP